MVTRPMAKQTSTSQGGFQAKAAARLAEALGERELGEHLAASFLKAGQHR